VLNRGMVAPRRPGTRAEYTLPFGTILPRFAKKTEGGEEHGYAETQERFVRANAAILEHPPPPPTPPPTPTPTALSVS